MKIVIESKHIISKSNLTFYLTNKLNIDKIDRINMGQNTSVCYYAIMR